MPSFSSYDDDLFFIISEIKNLRNGLKIAISYHLFIDLYMYHLNSLCKALQNIQERLLKYPKLIRFNEYLQLLRSSELNFIDLLNELLSHNSNSKLINEEITTLKTISEITYNRIIHYISNEKKSITEIDTVSNRETLELLSLEIPYDEEP